MKLKLEENFCAEKGIIIYGIAFDTYLVFPSP